MARLVRCPKCSKLLVEDPKVPVYKCGGCNTYLRAKNHQVPPENVVSGSLQTNSVDTSPADVGSISSATSPLTREESPRGLPPFNPPDVMSENGFSDKEMPPSCVSSPSVEGEHDGEEKRRGSAEVEEHSEPERNVTEIRTQLDEVTRSEDDEKVEKTLETSNDVEVSSQSIAYGTALMEDIVDSERRYSDENDSKSVANMSPRIYDGSISSSDDGDRGSRLRLPRRFLNDKLEIDQMASYLDDGDQDGALLSKSRRESYYFDVVESFNAIKQEMASKYPSGELEQRRSFDSVGSRKSSEIRPYRLRDSKGDFSEQLELLRKVDELKAQIIGLYAERDRSVPRGYSGNRQHDYPQLPFSGHKHSSCLHCSENQHAHFPVHELHPSSSKSGSLKEKPKRHCRPVSGAAPFVVCYHCMKLLQLPADFIISRRKLHKLQCGACDEILMLSFPGKSRTQPENQSGAEGKNVKAGSLSRPIYSGETKGNAPPRLHRLMGYDSASELLYTRSEFDQGYESLTSPVGHRYRNSAEILASLGAAARLGGSPRNASSPLSMSRDEFDSPVRLSARRTAGTHSGSAKESPKYVTE